MQDLKKKTYFKGDVQHWYLRITYQYGSLYVWLRDLYYFIWHQNSVGRKNFIMLHIIEKPNSIIFLLFIQNISKF